MFRETKDLFVEFGLALQIVDRDRNMPELCLRHLLTSNCRCVFPRSYLSCRSSIVDSADRRRTEDQSATMWASFSPLSHRATLSPATLATRRAVTEPDAPAICGKMIRFGASHSG